jgi:hypothetical protein
MNQSEGPFLITRGEKTLILIHGDPRNSNLCLAEVRKNRHINLFSMF